MNNIELYLAKNIDQASSAKRPVENGRVLVEFLGLEVKVSNGAKPCITRNALTTFVVLGPKELTCTLIRI